MKTENKLADNDKKISRPSWDDYLFTGEAGQATLTN
jgi:hypothetical protein